MSDRGYGALWNKVAESIYLVAAGTKHDDQSIKNFKSGNPAICAGTAFAVSPDGLFLTATHVIEEIEKHAQNKGHDIFLAARPSFGKEARNFFVTKIVKKWPSNIQDVTLLRAKVDKDIPFIPVRTYGPIEAPGRPVATFGYPLQLIKQKSDTAFEIQAVHRTFHGVICAIVGGGDESLANYEVDAIFNPGNSGGPLISTIQGDVIGVVHGQVQLSGQPTSISIAKVLTEIPDQKFNLGTELEMLGVRSSIDRKTVPYGYKPTKDNKEI